MTLIQQTYKVNQGIDDARDAGTTSTFKNDLTAVILSRSIIFTEYWNGIRFNNLILKNAETIISAKLWFAEFYSFGSNNISVKTYYEDSDNPAAMSSSRIPSQLAKGATTINKTFTTLDWVNAAQGVYVDYIDVTTLLQAIVNRPGWVSGNAVIFIVEALTSSSGGHIIQTFAYDGIPAYAAKLEITIDSNSIFEVHPQNTTVELGDSAVFTTEFSGYGSITYQWYKNFTLIPGATSATYTTPPTTQEDDGGLYYCIATDDNGDVRSDIAELSISIDSIVFNESKKRYRRPRHKTEVAWQKNSNYAQVDVTRLDDNFPIFPATPDDYLTGEFYLYDDESEYVKSLSIEQIINEPNTGVATTSVSAILQNTHMRFTLGYNSIIGDYIAPARPMRVSLGFKIGNKQYVIPQLYGLTAFPIENTKTREIQLSASDFIAYLADAYVESDTIYQNKRSDEIIKDLLTNPNSPEAKLQYPDSYLIFDEGLNTISFVYLKKGTRLIDVITQICEAEEAMFYQGQDGLLYFKTRDNFPVTSEYTFNGTEISVEDDTNTPILNRCKVKSIIREVQAEQTVFTLEYPFLISGGGTKTTLWVDTIDNYEEIGVPVSSFGSIAFTANTESDGSGTNITGDVIVDESTFVSRILFEITNNNASDGYLTSLTIQGTPASIVQTIDTEKENEASIKDFGIREYSIENDFITGSAWANTIAQSIVQKYGRILGDRIGVKIETPSLPTLSIRDKITVEYDSENIDYRITSITSKYSSSGGMISTIRARLIKNET